MAWKQRRPLGLLLGVSVCLWLAQIPAAAASDAGLEAEMLKAVEGLRSGALAPEDVGDSCVQSLKATDDERDYREVMTTFLEVPSDEAVAALCHAIVQSIGAGTITEEDLRSVLNSHDKDTEIFEVGRLLRAVYFSHHLSGSSNGSADSGQ